MVVDSSISMLGLVEGLLEQCGRSALVFLGFLSFCSFGVPS